MNYKEYKQQLKEEYEEYKQKLKAKFEEFKEKQNLKLEKFKLKLKNDKNKVNKRKNKKSTRGGAKDITEVQYNNLNINLNSSERNIYDFFNNKLFNKIYIEHNKNLENGIKDILKSISLLEDDKNKLKSYLTSYKNVYILAFKDYSDYDDIFNYNNINIVATFIESL